MANSQFKPDPTNATPQQGAHTLQTCLQQAEEILDQAGVDGYDVEARLLCEWVTGRTRLDFIARAHEPISVDQLEALRGALKQRLGGMPVHRIIGHREFYGLHLNLSKATLEPRPDTETLVDQILECVDADKNAASALRILDLGTGTGAIALALLSKLPHASALGVDISAEALSTARQNSKVNGLAGRFETLCSDWFAAVRGTFDIVVSNPPYIRSDIIDRLEVEVREHDPIVALDGGPDGLAPYREIALNAAAHLNPHGLVAVEIGYDQAVEVKKIFAERDYVFVGLRQDLAGHDRALLFKLPSV